jgi:drug/metabolite transporter (DMT)-like permease
MHEQHTGFVRTVLGAVLFGTLGIFGKGAITVDLSISTLLTWRFVTVTVVVWGVLLYKGQASLLPERTVVLELGLGAVYGIMSLAYFESLTWLSSGVAAVLLFTYPIQVTVLSSFFLNERVTGKKMLALMPAVAGVVLVVIGDEVTVAGAGMALVGVASFCYTIYSMGTRAVVSKISPLIHVAYVFLGVTITVVGYGGTTGSLSVPSGSESWAVIVGITIFGTVVPLVLFAEGLARIEASRASILSTGEPLMTVILGVVLLEEVVTMSIIAGAALILIGAIGSTTHAEQLIHDRIGEIRTKMGAKQ